MWMMYQIVLTKQKCRTSRAHGHAPTAFHTCSGPGRRICRISNTMEFKGGGSWGQPWGPLGSPVSRQPPTHHVFPAGPPGPDPLAPRVRRREKQVSLPSSFPEAAQTESSWTSRGRSRRPVLGRGSGSGTEGLSSREERASGGGGLGWCRPQSAPEGRGPRKSAAPAAGKPGLWLLPPLQGLTAGGATRRSRLRQVREHGKARKTRNQDGDRGLVC